MEDLETVLPGGVQVSTLEPVRAKDGHITLHLRVIGPRDRAVELVRNLEHSRRFLMPSIVGENSETQGGPNEQLQPVSASSRVNLDLLAEYNPAAPIEHRAAKPLASAEENAHKPVAMPVSAGLEQHATRPPYTGVSQPGVNRSKPNPGAIR